MQIPKNEKRKIEPVKALKLFLYGVPHIGKTTFANQAPNALLINTDGNVKFMDSPVHSIKDEFNEDGKLTKSGWEVFLETVDTLLGNPDDGYETYVVDLLDDIYQFCRVYWQKKLKIEHESEANGGKGWDIVRNNFYVVIKRLLTCDKNVILIGHEVSTTVKDRLGREITTYSPALPDKVYGKISGLVEATARIKSEVIKTEDGREIDMRVLSIANTKEEVCGTKIPTIRVGTIPLGWDNFVKAIGGDTFEDSISEQTEVARDSNPEVGGRTERVARDSSSRRAVR